MPYKIVRNEQNLTKKITYPEGASDQQILDYASRMFGGQFQIAEPSLLGGAGALAKGTGAGFASTVLGAAQGPTAFVEEVAARGWKENLADATSAVLGALKSDSIFDKEGKYLGLEERDKVEEKENKDRSDAILGAIGGTRTPESVINSQKFLGQGIRDLRKSIVESDALAVDPEYQDHWSYKFGNALGSLGTFASIGLATRGKGPKAELVLPAFSVATGAGDQAERIARAREEGKSVDTAQALQSLSLGAAVGLTELAPVERLFKGLPKDLPAGFKNQIVARLKNALVTGGVEGTQEVAASLLQDLIERRIYNESLPFGQTMADDFTYGAAAGFAADLVLNAVAGRRSSLSTEEDLDYEKELRDEEDKQAQKYISSLTTPPVAPTPDQEIDPAQIAAPTQEDLAASVTTIDGKRGPVERVQFGTLYASKISQSLGDQFPSGIKFDVVEDQDQEGMDISFRVVDETGKQYGQRLASRRQANALSGNLNRISVDNAVAKSARDIVSSDKNAYTPEQAEQAFRLAYRALHPEYNTFGTLAVNQAAGTTAENGYREDLNYKTILAGQEIKKRGKVVGYEITAPNGKKSIVKGLTAAQQINKKRDEQGLGQARRFSKEEVTSALGKKADNLIGTFRPTQRWRAVSRRDGTYGIVSESGEFISRRPLTAREVDQRARTPEGGVSSVVPMTLGRGRAKGFVRSTEGGAPVNLGDGMVRIGSMKEARDFAQRMNSSSPPTTSIREVVGDTPTVKSYLKALKDVLRAKNITSRTKSEEMKSLFKLITGKESLAQMNEFERGLVYQRIRSLPRFDSQTALPNLSPRSFTPTQLARASRFIKDSDNRGVRYTPLDVAQAAGVAPSSSDVASIGTDLINEYKSQSPKAVPLLLPSPDSFGPNPLDSLLGSLKSVLKGYGFGDLKLSLGQTLVDPSGKLLGEETNAAYERYTKTLLFAVDRIDPNGALTPAQQEAALVDLLNHEVVHAARALDLWTEQEWSLLEKAVSRLKPEGSDTTYLENAINLYPDANPVVQIEEAVAELVRNYINNKKTVSGKPENLIKRFLSFMQRLSSAIRGTGFNTYQDVIDLLESGQLGARERGVVRTQRLGEEQRAQQGSLPERLRPIISAVSAPSAPSAPPPPERRGAGDFFADLPKEYTEKVEPEQEPSPVIRRSVRTKYVDGQPVAVVEIDGVDRPVNNALGRPIHQTLEGIKSFWRWFGDSQLVDARGRPIVFYHGTARDIDQFRPKQADAVFGSPSVRFAESFAEASLDWMNANYDQVFTSDQMIKSSRDMIERYKRLSSDVEAQIDSIARDEYKNAESSGASGFVTKGIYDIFFGENGAINKLKKSAGLRIGRMESAIKSFEENIKDIDAQIKKNLAIPAGKRTQKDDDDLNLLEEQRKERNSTLQSSMRLGIEGGPPVQIAQVEVDNSPLFFAENLKDADNKSLSSLRYMSVNLLNRVRLSASLKATDVIDLSVKEAMPSGPNIIPLYFAPKNIFDYENESHLSGLADYLMGAGANEAYTSNVIDSVRDGDWKEIEGLYVQRHLRAAGYDSFFVKENEEKNIAVYNNAAVKSALGNNGQFSPETPVIRESRRAAPAEAVAPQTTSISPDTTSIRQAPEPHPITSIGLLDGTETAPPMQSGSHVARFLQNRAIQILGGPLDIKQESAREFVAEAIASEAIAEMARKEEALEWYDTTVETMIENLSIQFPEILTDSNSRTALLVSIAVTSQNMAVPDNLRAGVEIYSGWRRTGLFPEKGFGAKAPAIKNNFEKANAIIQYLNGNGNGMADFAALLNDSYTVRELNDILNRILPGTKIGGERLDTRVYGSAVLGPKIGQGFYSNLRGEFSPVTIDMWFMRMIGRLTGTLTKYNPTLLDDQLVRLARASGLDQVSQESLTDEIRNDLISLSEETLSQHERNFKQFRAEYDSGVRTKSDAVKISERIKANLKGMNDAPTSPVQRDNLRDIVERARAKLKDYTGMDIPAASLQALVWYPEQRLHKNLGAKLRVTETDYAKSSRAFLLNQGVSESELDAAERRVRQRRESGSGRVRPGDVAADTGAEQGVRTATGAPVLREARRTPISKDVEQAAFDAAKRIADETPPGGIPLYNLNATRFSLAVAQNPQISTPLSSDESIRFSRNRPPRLSSQESSVIDRLTGDPVVKTTPGQAYIAATGLGKVTATLNMLRKEMVNRYAGIEYYERTDPRLVGNLADSSALAALEFRDRYKGIFASAITDGVVSYVPVQDAQGNVTGYVTKVVDFYHNGKKMAGLIDVMKPLFDNDYGVNLENLAQSYAIAIRAERLAKEGKETPAKAGDLATLKTAVDKYLNAETGRPIIEEWYETWQAYNSKIVDFLEATGVIDSKGADLWRDQADYVPFYREIAVGSNNEALVRAPKIFGGMTSAAGFTRLKGGDTGVNVPLLDSILRNYEAAISMGMSNVAQQRVVRDMLTIGMAEMLRFNEDANGKDVVSFKFKGQKVRAYIKDPVVYQSLQNVDPGFLDSAVFNVVFRKPAEVVRELITREPAYMLANMMRDSISAWQNTGADIIPVVSTATAMFSNPIEALRKYGIVNGYDFGADPSDVVNFFSKEAFKQGIDIPTEKRATSDMITQSLAMKPIMLLWDALGGMSAMSEAASRKAVYDSVLRETGNEAEAAYQALRVINYSRRGNNKALRFITSSVPFMNARIQGLDVMYMAASGRFGAKRSSMSKGKIASSFLIRGAMLTALSMYYYLLVSDTEEYKEATEEDRDNYYIIPVVKGDKENGVKGYSFYIPKPFENGLIFSTIPERIMASIDGLYTTKESRDFALRAIGNTLAMNPLPQVAKPVIESVSNTSFFTGRPIVPVFEQMNKLPYLQYRPTTNEAARLVSRELAERGLADISPMKIEHVARGYFGTLGTYVLNAVDSITRSATGADLPSRRIVDYPIVRRFVRQTGDSGLENQFYELRTNVDQIVGSLKKLQEEGRIDEYNAMMRSKGGLVQVKRWVLKTEQRLSKLRNYKNAIMTNQNYDPDTRMEMVDQIDEQMRMVVSDIEIARRMAYGTEPSESMEGLRQSVR